MAEIAREALRGLVERFNEDTKPSMLQRIGISSAKSAKTKATEILENSVHGDFNELRASVDNLEKKWKESHGPVSLGLDSCAFESNHSNICQIDI